MDLGCQVTSAALPQPPVQMVEERGCAAGIISATELVGTADVPKSSAELLREYFVHL